MKGIGWQVASRARPTLAVLGELCRAGAPIDAQDKAACDAILARGSKSFHAAGRLLPPRLRASVTAFYAFCREADDAIDECGPGEMDGAVAGLRERLDRVFAAQLLRGPVDRALARVVAHHAVPRALVDALIEGFLWDAQRRRYDTLSGVFDYSARVAGAVGVIMSLLMDRREPHTLARAADLGVAMQLTNIARDVGADARMGRVYLPLQWLLGAGVDPDEWVRDPSVSPRIGGVIARLLDESDRLYLRADGGIGALPIDCRPAIAAARLLYADIGREIREAAYDSISTRHHTSGWRKLALCARATQRLWSNAPADSAPPLAETRFLVEAVHRQQQRVVGQPS